MFLNFTKIISVLIKISFFFQFFIKILIFFLSLGILPIYPLTQGASTEMRSHFASQKYVINRRNIAYFYSLFLTGSDDSMDDWLNGKVLSEVRRHSPAIEETLALDGQELPEIQGKF